MSEITEPSRNPVRSNLRAVTLPSAAKRSSWAKTGGGSSGRRLALALNHCCIAETYQSDGGRR